MFNNSEMCLKYKEPKPRPTTVFSLVKRFNETVALD